MRASAAPEFDMPALVMPPFGLRRAATQQYCSYPGVKNSYQAKFVHRALGRGQTADGD